MWTQVLHGYDSFNGTDLFNNFINVLELETHVHSSSALIKYIHG